MRDRSNDYEALCLHLNPQDFTDGAWQLDTAILALQRARSRSRNQTRFCCHVGLLCLLASEAIGALYYCIWLDPALMPTPFGLIQNIPLWVGLPLALLGLGLVRFSFRLSDRHDLDLPAPPLAIRQWLRAHEYRHGLLYWHSMYWPQRKQYACRRTIFGYIFWRASPIRRQ